MNEKELAMEKLREFADCEYDTTIWAPEAKALLEYIKQLESGEMMNSSDYKERFKAEYQQTKTRYDKLHNIIIRYEAKTLDFELTCDIDMLKRQAKAMGEYLYCLEVRAEIEKIDL